MSILIGRKIRILSSGKTAIITGDITLVELDRDDDGVFYANNVYPVIYKGGALDLIPYDDIEVSLEKINTN